MAKRGITGKVVNIARPSLGRPVNHDGSRPREICASVLTHSGDSHDPESVRSWGYGVWGMAAMAQQVCVVLSTAEGEQLLAIAADRNRPRKHIERARIVLASADRHSAQRVAQRIGVSRPTVRRWQQRFAESGADGPLRDKTRKPGKAPIAAEVTARVVALTCTEPPHEATHWTSRSMAKAVGISLGSVHASGRRINCSRTGCAP